MSGCRPKLIVHLKERKPQTTEELLNAAKVYHEAQSDVKLPRSGLEQQIRMLKSERDKNSPGSPSGAKEIRQRLKPRDLKG